MTNSRRYFYSVTVNDVNTAQFNTRKEAEEYRNAKITEKLNGSVFSKKVSDIKMHWEKI